MPTGNLAVDLVSLPAVVNDSVNMWAGSAVVDSAASSSYWSIFLYSWALSVVEATRLPGVPPGVATVSNGHSAPV